MLRQAIADFKKQPETQTPYKLRFQKIIERNYNKDGNFSALSTKEIVKVKRHNN